MMVYLRIWNVGTGTYRNIQSGDTIINITSRSEDGKPGSIHAIHVINPADANLRSLAVEKTVSYDKSVKKDYILTVNNPKRSETNLLEEIRVSAPNNTVFIDSDFEIYGQCVPYATIKGTGKFRAGSKVGNTTFVVKVIAEDKVTVQEHKITIHVIDPYGDGWYLSGNTLHIGNRDRSKAIPRYDQSPRYRYRDYIKHVSFDDNLSVIPPLMLYGCKNITELQLPTALKEIGNNAFTGCDNPGGIISEAAIPPKVNRCTFLGSKGLHIGNKDVQVYIRDKVLYIDSPAEERITVYSVTGKLLRRLEKPAGKASFASAGSSTGGVLIVRGSSSWAEKVVDN